MRGWYDPVPARKRAQEAEQLGQAFLLRCIFEGPCRALVVQPAWRSPVVMGLAEAAYEERALPWGMLENERLLVLADALEERGASGPLLEHLRWPGPHVRGCHAVDAILGRS